MPRFGPEVASHRLLPSLSTMKVFLLFAVVAAVRCAKPPSDVTNIKFPLALALDDSNQTDQASDAVPATFKEAINNPLILINPQSETPGIGVFIIDGEEVEYGTRPYICSLQVLYEGSWYFICGAIVRNVNTVITAGHCVEGSFPSNLRVVCGDYFLRQFDEFEVVKPIAEYRLHPMYSNNGRRGYPNDIALMRVATPLVFNEYINTLPIPGLNTPIPIDCTILGWGITETGDIADVVREVEITRLTTGQCQAVWGRRAISRRHVCFGVATETASSCSGDSGGPAVCGNFLVGVTSWGATGCGARFPSVYTRLSAYLSWIEDNEY